MHIVTGLVPVVSVIVLFAARLIELGTKRQTVPGSVKEILTFRLFLLVGMLMFVSSLTEYFLRGNRVSWLMFLIGGTCAVVSFAIRRQAIATLGRFWSLHIEIRENHQFVCNGPFRWMRHPTYFSMILELLSVGLLLQAWLSCAIIPLFFLPVLCWRLKLEEKALVEKFGEAYRAYQKSTPALFPTRPPAVS